MASPVGWSACMMIENVQSEAQHTHTHKPTLPQRDVLLPITKSIQHNIIRYTHFALIIPCIAMQWCTHARRLACIKVETEIGASERTNEQKFLKSRWNSSSQCVLFSFGFFSLFFVRFILFCFVARAWRWLVWKHLNLIKISVATQWIELVHLASAVLWRGGESKMCQWMQPDCAHCWQIPILCAFQSAHHRDWIHINANCVWTSLHFFSLSLSLSPFCSSLYRVPFHHHLYCYCFRSCTAKLCMCVSTYTRLGCIAQYRYKQR